MPQIEVTFDIDANGILHVSAKDKATGKENKIKIQANSGLNEAEIQRMVKDAEAHAEDDRKFKEVVDSRNKADQMIHATEKSLNELGDKVSGEDRAKIESALSDLKSSLGSDDKDIIEKKTQALAEASASLAQQAYAQASAAEGAAAGGAGGGDQANANAGKDDVLDAEFEEVKDKK
jgi:molecular chaperone DnaK